MSDFTDKLSAVVPELGSIDIRELKEVSVDVFGSIEDMVEYIPVRKATGATIVSVVHAGEFLDLTAPEKVDGAWGDLSLKTYPIGGCVLISKLPG